MATVQQWRLAEAEEDQDRPHLRISIDEDGYERREHRRHDLETREVTVERWDGSRRLGEPIGTLVDLSAGGLRIRTTGASLLRADQQIRIRMELPTFAGICPFVRRTTSGLRPSREWIGWMTVARVHLMRDGTTEIAGRLVDMDEIDRGVLGLYLSTQPLAA